MKDEERKTRPPKARRASKSPKAGARTPARKAGDPAASSSKPAKGRKSGRTVKPRRPRKGGKVGVTGRAPAGRGVRKGRVADTPVGRTEPGRAREAVEPAVGRVVEEGRVLTEHRVQGPPFEVQYELPENYGQDRMVAMVRDPYWIYTYWEIDTATVARALRNLGRAAVGARRVLRVYSGEARTNRAENFLFDIAVTVEARNWYVNVGGPGRTYRVELGLLTRDRVFVCLVASNSVTLPPDRMSDLIDEEWTSLPLEYYGEMYALSGGLSLAGPALTSPGLHERLAKRLEERLASPLFSPGVGAVVGAEELEAPFWLRLDADLVVYGATVPNSYLTVKGGNCSLRDDGTFSFRCHLPDGKKEIVVSSRSADGEREEVIEVTVTRSTR